MRVVRFQGENVSPSDDGRLYQQIFFNGLFNIPTIAPAGGSQINIGALYGVIRGRDFTCEAQSIDAVLPTGEGTATGVIFAEIDISKAEPLSIKTALNPWTPTNEDINVSGVVAQTKIGYYEANATAVTVARYEMPNPPVSPLDQYAALKREDEALGNRLTSAEQDITYAQGQIEATNNTITQLRQNLPDLLKVVTAAATVTGLAPFSAGQYYLNFSIPSGYRFLMNGAVRTGGFVGVGYLTFGHDRVWLANPTNATVSGTVEADILCIRTNN